MTPELALPSPNFRSISAGGNLTLLRFNMHQAHKHGGYSAESRLEPEALRLGSRDLTPNPPSVKSTCVSRSNSGSLVKRSPTQLARVVFNKVYRILPNTCTEKIS
ncbi:hypothetical protein AVEN_116428-1 [Araneus ventricosus]|uniref:Uncharacterized protein n=1 Tax=Araneus ventricosus TaxID=182803 RepID=A0A4Y2KLD5_ARAVE|nr:hypothetical protein AVEN_116428-1 [Araneus ventricosus]